MVGSEESAVLGEGSYGRVYKAKDKSKGRNVAIKTIKMSKLSEVESRLMLQEIELFYVLSEDRHPGFIEMLDVFEDEESGDINIVMELFEGKSLY